MLDELPIELLLLVLEALQSQCKTLRELLYSLCSVRYSCHFFALHEALEQCLLTFKAEWNTEPFVVPYIYNLDSTNPSNFLAAWNPRVNMVNHASWHTVSEPMAENLPNSLALLQDKLVVCKSTFDNQGQRHVKLHFKPAFHEGQAVVETVDVPIKPCLQSCNLTHQDFLEGIFKDRLNITVFQETSLVSDNARYLYVFINHFERKPRWWSAFLNDVYIYDAETKQWTTQPLSLSHQHYFFYDKATSRLYRFPISCGFPTKFFTSFMTYQVSGTSVLGNELFNTHQLTLPTFLQKQRAVTFRPLCIADSKLYFSGTRWDGATNTLFFLDLRTLQFEKVLKCKFKATLLWATFANGHFQAWALCGLLPDIPTLDCVLAKANKRTTKIQRVHCASERSLVRIFVTPVTPSSKE